MTVNERWVVYPLLFLSLGVAMRDKVVQRVQLDEIAADQVRCNRLMVAEADCRLVKVTGPSGTGGVLLGARPDGTGRLEVRGANNQPLVVVGGGPSGGVGTIETFDAQRRPLARVLGTDSGGAIATFDRKGNVLVLGQTGLRRVVPHLGDARPLSYPWPLGTPEPSPGPTPPVQ